MSTKTVNPQATVQRRVRRFYDLLNRQEYRDCFAMIDPQVRHKASSVTLFQYENSLREFLERFGSIEVVESSLELHLNEPSKLYDGRDFAIGKTNWKDSAGEQHVFSERWVREGRLWYTRSTGLLAPASVR